MVSLVLVVLGKPSESRADLVTDYFSGVGTYNYSYADSGFPISFFSPPPHYVTGSQNVLITGYIKYDNVSFLIMDVGGNIYDMSLNPIGGQTPMRIGSQIFAAALQGYDNSQNYAGNGQFGSSTNDAGHFSISRSNDTGRFQSYLQIMFTDTPYYKYRGSVDAGITAFSSTPINITATPVPAAAYLFGSGLLALMGIRKRIQKK
jgi:hypothetical protein